MTMFRYFRDNEGRSYHFAARIVNVAQLGGADFHEAYRVAETIEVGDRESWHRAWQAAGKSKSGPKPRSARPAHHRAGCLPGAHLLDWFMEEVNRPRGQTKFP